MHRLLKYADIYIASPDTLPIKIKKIFEFLETHFGAIRMAPSEIFVASNPSGKRYHIFFVYQLEPFTIIETDNQLNGNSLNHHWIITLKETIEDDKTPASLPGVSLQTVFVNLGYSKVMVQIRYVLKLILAHITSMASDKSSLLKKETFTNNLHALLQEHFQNPEFRTAHLAQLMNLSVSSIERYSVKYLQKLPRKLLLEFRLNHAHHLVINTNLTIRAIASQSGFISSSYFSICFTDKFGTSPRNMRLSINQQLPEKPG
jgi:AraC-like DNA-binding protein